jgi:hypothetical protein
VQDSRAQAAGGMAWAQAAGREAGVATEHGRGSADEQVQCNGERADKQALKHLLSGRGDRRSEQENF